MPLVSVPKCIMYRVSVKSMSFFNLKTFMKHFLSCLAIIQFKVLATQ